jgi:hypothetical protein
MNARGMRRLLLGEPLAPVLIQSTTTYQVLSPQQNWIPFISNLAGTMTIQLPLAVGSGFAIEVYVGTLSAGQTTIVQRGISTDRFQGSVFIGVHNATTGKVFQASQVSNANTLTLNGTTTGGVSVGDTVLFTDIMSGIWSVQGTVVGSGTLATPFSNT